MCIMHIPWCSFVDYVPTICIQVLYVLSTVPVPVSKLWRHAFYETFLVHFRPSKMRQISWNLTYNTSLAHVNTGTGTYYRSFYNRILSFRLPQSVPLCILACNFHRRLVICYFDMFSLSYCKLLPARHSSQKSAVSYHYRYLILIHKNCAWWS